MALWLEQAHPGPRLLDFMRRFATPLIMALLSSVSAPGSVFSDLEYGRAGGTSLRMDVRTPAGHGPFPALVLVHGGGWVRGDRTWNMAPLFDPLTRAGFVTCSISYRLAADFFQFGAAIDDVQTAIHYVRQHAAEYNVDPRRIAVLGESAGGHLAAMAALREPGSVQAVVGLYTPTDLEALARSSPAVPAQIRQTLESSGFAALLAAHLRSLSPIEHVRADAPAFLLIHGTADGIVPYDQATRMAERMKSAGAVCEIMTVRGGAHGLRFWDRSPEQAGYRDGMIAWLRNRLRSST